MVLALSPSSYVVSFCSSINMSLAVIFSEIAAPKASNEKYFLSDKKEMIYIAARVLKIAISTKKQTRTSNTLREIAKQA